jgi:hypothetical protein
MIKIYGKPGCTKCRMTKMQLPQADYVELSLDDPMFETFRAQGVLSMPVVQVFGKNCELLDEWSDFQIDKIKQYKTA